MPNIRKIEGSGSLVIAEEKPEELNHRLEQEKADNALKRHQNKTTYYVALISLILIGLASAVISLSPSKALDANLVAFSRDVLKVIAAGVVGYVLGKAK